MDTQVDSCKFVRSPMTLEGYNIKVTSCQFINITSTSSALVLYSYSNSLDLVSDCLFEGNHVHAEYTGVLHYESRSTGGIALFQTTFRNNMVKRTSHELFEGLINIISGSRLTVTKCQFDCNQYIVAEHNVGEPDGIFYYPPIDSDRHPQDYFTDNSFGSCPLSVSFPFSFVFS